MACDLQKCLKCDPNGFTLENGANCSLSNITVQLLRYKQQVNNVTVELRFSARVTFPSEVSDAIKLYIDDVEISYQVLQIRDSQVYLTFNLSQPSKTLRATQKMFSVFSTQHGRPIAVVAREL